VFETGAPQPPADQPVVESGQLPPEDQVVIVATRGVGYDATSVVIQAGPPPGTVTYRLRATETSQDA
jgi:hypothetical protein